MATVITTTILSVVIPPSPTAPITRIANGKPDLNLLFIYNIPFRGMAKMMNGMVSMDMADDIRFIANGHFFRGVGRLVKHFINRPKLAKAK